MPVFCGNHHRRDDRGVRNARRANFIQGQFCHPGGVGPTCLKGRLLGFRVSPRRGPREGGPAMSGPVDRTVLAQPDPTAEDLQFACVAYFARTVSPSLRIDEREIFDALSCMPDAMLEMLESPEGWAELAAIVVDEQGGSASACQPVRH